MYGCGEQEAGVGSGSGWNLWVWLLGVVVRRYIDSSYYLFLLLLYLFFFTAASLLFVHFLRSLYIIESVDSISRDEPDAQSIDAIHYKRWNISR